MITKFPTIVLHQGATTIVNFDLSKFDFQGGYVMLTIKDKDDILLQEQKMNVQGINQVIFTDEFTAKLKLGKKVYKYDLMWHLKEERFAQCLPSDIDVVETVGGFE